METFVKQNLTQTALAKDPLANIQCHRCTRASLCLYCWDTDWTFCANHPNPDRVYCDMAILRGDGLDHCDNWFILLNTI